jgi:hypothetical protein
MLKKETKFAATRFIYKLSRNGIQNVITLGNTILLQTEVGGGGEWKKVQQKGGRP